MGTLTAIMKRSFFMEQGVLVFFALAAHLCSSAHLHQDLDQALELDARESKVQVDATVEVNVKTPSPSSPNPPANPPAPTGADEKVANDKNDAVANGNDTNANDNNAASNGADEKVANDKNDAVANGNDANANDNNAASNGPCDASWISEKETYGCEHYKKNGWCITSAPYYGPKWLHEEWGKFEEWVDTKNRSALVCPQCGCDINECDEQPCQNHGLCTNTHGSYICECSSAYQGTNCELDVNECDQQPCQNNGSCTNIRGSYTCKCSSGYHGKNCELDINECDQQPCQNNGSCTNTAGSYICDCSNGHIGANCEMVECYNAPKGLDYRGTKSTTKSGRVCQNWNTNSPHKHNIKMDDDHKNYCRNPEQTQGKEPWCFTTDKETKFEYCGVPQCPDPLQIPRSQVTVANWEYNKCEEKCKNGLTLQRPACPGGRFGAQYHPRCTCLIGYRCCPSSCPKVDDDKCDRGVSVPQRQLDNCGCSVVKCIACPTVKKPKCNTQCSEISFKEIQATGCRVPMCKIRCPKIEVAPCNTKCEKMEIAKNASLCNCPQRKCVKKTCPKAAMLSQKPCFKVINQTDECGCLVYKHTRKGFCDAKDKLADDLVCNDPRFGPQCLTKSINQDVCGCDRGECVRKTENCVHKFPASDVCPKSHYRQNGVTPCGLDRDICIKCEDADLSAGQCNQTCNNIVEDKNKFGCLTKRCVPKACAISTPKCKFCEQLVMSPDDCGCPVAKCVEKCPDIDRSDCKGGPSYSTWILDACGCKRVTCVNRPREVLPSSIGSYSAIINENANETMTYDAARQICKNAGGYMAIIGSKAEDTFVRTSKNYDASKSYWIGAKCSAIAGNEQCMETGKFNFDVQILVDGSVGVGELGFRMVMKDIADILVGNLLNIGQSNDRVALTIYSNTTNHVLRMKQNTEKKAVIETLNAAAYPNGYAYTAKAMIGAWDFFEEEQRTDNKTVRVCLVFTDGQTIDDKELVAARKRWSDAGVLVFAIGIGKNIDNTELIIISGAKTRAIQGSEKITDVFKQVCRLLTEKYRFYHKLEKEEVPFKEASYPPTTISQEDEGFEACPSGDGGFQISGKDQTSSWYTRGVNQAASGVLCEFPTTMWSSDDDDKKK